MAVQVLKRSQAVVWLPPRSVGERAFVNEPVILVAQGGDEGRGGYQRCSLDSMPAVKSVYLLFDGRDTNLLSPLVPVLPEGRLIKALPNIVEEQLLQDAASCAFAIGPKLDDGKRMVAVIDRGWLEFVVGAFERRGLNVLAAWPSQLCLPLPSGGAAIACVANGITLRNGPLTSVSWSASDDADFRAEALRAVIKAAALERDQPLRLCIDDDGWRAVFDRVLGAIDPALMRISALPLPEAAPVDLLQARAGNARQRWLANVDWPAWRLPLALAAACVVAGLAGLNLHWGQLNQERKALQVQLERKFRQAFPNAQVVVDPMLQMQRQVGELRSRAGQSGPDDFLPLLARFAQALGPRLADGVTGVDYRDGQLRVKFPASAVESRAMRDTLRESCRRKGLVLNFDNDADPVASVRITS